MSQGKSFFLEVVYVRYFVTAMTKVTNSENWYHESGVIGVTNPTMWFLCH
jgi:hypothetical protein